MSSYEAIKDCVNLGFEEYVTHQHYNNAQAAAKIVEEDWWILNEDNFSKTAFFICLALESLKMNEIADFILFKLDAFLRNLQFEDYIQTNDRHELLHDISLYKERMEMDNYQIIETNPVWKGRLESILSLKREDL